MALKASTITAYEISTWQQLDDAAVCTSGMDLSVSGAKGEVQLGIKN